MKIGFVDASVADLFWEICKKMLHPDTKKGSLPTSSFRVPSGILPLRSSDFVDYEPLWVLIPPDTKKGSLPTSFFRVPSGIRTHDIQNHNLTL